MTDHIGPIWEFISCDKYQITGRGTVYVVDLPDVLWSAETRPRLSGQVVRIDGVIRTVRGVEMFCIPWSPKTPKLRTVGLLVSDE